MNPLISIIIPVYNVEKCLSECIDSVLNQSYQNLEIILVDDGSTDKSGMFCDSYAAKDERVRVFHKENGGASSARNKGIEEAKGEYIIFVDSDDKVEQSYCEELYRSCSEKGSDISICGYREVFSDHEVQHVLTKDEHAGLSGVLDKDLFRINDHICGPVCKLYKTSVIKDNDICFDTSYTVAEDQVFNFRYYDKIKTCTFVNLPLYTYNRKNSSLTTRRKLVDFQSAVNGLILKDKYLRKHNVAEGKTIVADDLCYIFLSYLRLEDASNDYGSVKGRIQGIDIEWPNVKLKGKRGLLYPLLRRRIILPFFFICK